MVRVVTERNTRQRRAIREAFERAGRPLSTEEVLSEAQATIQGIGMATVYRSIRSLVDEGWLTPVEVPGRTLLYERSGKEHHHHFVCENCSRVFELEGCASEVKARLPRGFRATGHDVTIYGRCAECARPPARR